ncbi:alpha-glucosidase [Thiospirochaeta perfilievii]|uniref:Alpha-glucosidase n=1 Tax=Thiospirochaeta perfilievii TaxID=252967 RepID=A0A5C1QB69_9SPIO|nr:alpha-glucosidase [Thiospirochaeta perfilievii]QEN04300.1 alpha-glucosidase [Thiospirochaeta perfilievii]
MYWKNSVVYQIYPRSFLDSNSDGIGDIQGIISKLDYLENLGVDILWICPVYDSPMDDNGYDISDYYNIAKEFGTLEDMKKLIYEAGKRGLKIIMDLVINHTSDEHSWFLESKSSLLSSKREWYIWADPDKNGDPPSNIKSIFGGSSWEFDEKTKQYYFHVFSKKQPCLNWNNREVRTQLYKMINWWLDLGISGFRVDAITYIKKSDRIFNPSNTNDIHCNDVCLNQNGIDKWLNELKLFGFENGEVMTVAEAPGVQGDNLLKYTGSSGFFSMIFTFDHVDLDLKDGGLWNDPKNWGIKELRKALFSTQKLLDNSGWPALYFENHDQPRSINKYFPEKSISIYTKKLLAMLLFFQKGTPFIYQGQEIGMTNVKYDSIEKYKDIASVNQYNECILSGFTKNDALKVLWNRSRDNSRTPMQWSREINAGFSKIKPWIEINENYTYINVEDQLINSKSLLHFYRSLIKLRKSSEYRDLIIYGKFIPLLQNSQNLISFKREYKNKYLIFICNFSDKEVPYNPDCGIDKVVVSNYETWDILLQFNRLRAYETVVYIAK